MNEIERLERIAKQMAVVALELNAMGEMADGAYLLTVAERLLKRSMALMAAAVVETAAAAEDG